MHTLKKYCLFSKSNEGMGTVVFLTIYIYIYFLFVLSLEFAFIQLLSPWSYPK